MNGAAFLGEMMTYVCEKFRKHAVTLHIRMYVHERLCYLPGLRVGDEERSWKEFPNSPKGVSSTFYSRYIFTIQNNWPLGRGPTPEFTDTNLQDPELLRLISYARLFPQTEFSDLRIREDSFGIPKLISDSVLLFTGELSFPHCISNENTELLKSLMRFGFLTRLDTENLCLRNKELAKLFFESPFLWCWHACEERHLLHRDVTELLKTWESCARPEIAGKKKIVTVPIEKNLLLADGFVEVDSSNQCEFVFW